mmetsp:Transcript_18834/g.31491  ORF Transcript_18834/g.31491 Transcript_18834/m.31491 type:complete len:731 (+) Transcript_18834:36-2228(+)
MRFWVHWEDEPAFTLSVIWADTDLRTVAHLCDQFAAAHAKMHPEHAVNGELLILATEEGQQVPREACVGSILADDDDIFATRSAVAAPPAPALPVAVPVAKSPVASLSAGDASSGAASIDKEALAPYQEAADKAWKSRQYAKAKSIHAELLALQPRLAGSLRRLGEIEVICGRPLEAVPLLQKAVDAEPRNLSGRLLLAQACADMGENGDAVEVLEEALEMTKVGSKAHKKVQLQLGRTLFKGGDRNRGGNLLTEILKADMDDAEAQQAYGEACIELEQIDNALKIYLRLITTKSEDRTIRRLLARSLKASGALALLAEQLPAQPSSAAALAFLATIVKDHSGVEQGIELYKQTCAVAPENTSYALNYCHTIELSLDYARAIEVVRMHCLANPDRSVGGVSCRDVAATLPTRDELLAANSSSPTTGTKVQASGVSLRMTANPNVPAEAGRDTKDQAEIKPAGTYSSEDLDLLALFYTSVKILFVMGALEAASALVCLVEPARAVKDLHLTLVRNENAYYCCAAQLLTSMPMPLPSLPLLYIAGDSHSLSPAWRTIMWQGKPHLLRPMLVTGLKAWHLRTESDFFPKANFHAAMRQIPNGATVIFAFGEIDCREGLLVAVERAYYKDLQEGIDTVISIYISQLNQLAKARGFTVLVHPVPPVLNETRSVVTGFNATLKDRVTLSPHLQWLDFFEKLLSPDGSELADGLSLDGTHMSPAYLDHLEEALSTLF